MCKGAIAFIIAGCVVASLGFAEGAPDFSRPKKHLGFSTSKQDLILWTELSPVKLSTGSAVPLRLRFSTENGTPAAIFGRFWWCPVLEATLLPKDENTLIFTTLGGRPVYLHQSKEGKYFSKDERYMARSASPSEWFVEADGWRYRFINGRLKGFEDDKGAVVDLNYGEGSRVESLTERGKGDVLSLSYKAREPLCSGIVVGAKKYDLTTQNIPRVIDASGAKLIAGYDPSLASIKGARSNEVFPIVFNVDGTFTMAYQGPNRISQEYVWEAVGGKIKSDGQWTYSSTLRPDGNLVVSRTNQAKQVESYFYDARTGISQHLRPDGTQVTRTYFIGSGPLLNKIRNLVEKAPGRAAVERLWSYDEKGNLIRERSGDWQKTWSYFDNGQIAAQSETLKDIVQSGETFDKDGRLLSRQNGDKTYKFTYETGRTVVQRIENGVVTATKVTDLKTQQAVVFSGDLEKTNAYKIGSRLSATEVDNAVALAKAAALRATENLKNEQD